VDAAAVERQRRPLAGEGAGLAGLQLEARHAGVHEVDAGELEAGAIGAPRGGGDAPDDVGLADHGRRPEEAARAGLATSQVQVRRWPSNARVAPPPAKPQVSPFGSTTDSVGPPTIPRTGAQAARVRGRVSSTALKAHRRHRSSQVGRSAPMDAS
jgi:hypothetical protein